MDLVARLDLVFCIDVTASMGPFIDAARAQMLRILEELRGVIGDGLRVAVVAYRDHGAEKLLEIARPSESVKDTEAFLRGLSVGSGPYNTDAAEAVFAALAACIEMPWRDGAYRAIVLAGDAPPHGCGASATPYPDRFPDGDPSGFDLDGMANRLEEEGIFVHALAMIPSSHRQHDAVLARAFERLGVSTGGSYHAAGTADAAMTIVEKVSRRFLAEIAFDRELLAKVGAAPIDEARVAALAKELRATEAEIGSGLMRLRQRRLLG